MAKIGSQVCLWPVGNTDCGKVAVDKVQLAGWKRIPTCAEHKAEHNRTSAARRVEAK